MTYDEIIVIENESYPNIKYIIHRYDHAPIFTLAEEDWKNRTFYEFEVDEITPIRARILEMKEGEQLKNLNGQTLKCVSRQEREI